MILSQTFSSLSQTITFRSFQTGRVWRRQCQINENGGKISKWVENTVGNGEIAR